MTVIDDFRPQIETTGEELAEIAFDLYRDIHKGIRADLFTTTATAGRIDPLDRDCRVGLATQVSSLMAFLDQHAEHEDTFVEPAVRDFLPRIAEEIEADHRSFERRGELLVELGVQSVESTGSDCRRLGHRLYLDLASFTSTYLAHQDVEERVIMPALQRQIGVPAVMGIHQAILSSIPPADMGEAQSIMLPAMNNDDRAEMLGGMRAGAPAEVFAGAWALTKSVIPRPDVAPLAARLGIVED